MALDSRKLDRRIRLERGAPTDNGYNTELTFAELATVWAQFLPARGAERFEAMGREAQMPATWRIRWSRALADLSSADRLYEVRSGDRVGPIYDIVNVITLPRDGEVRIDCIAGDESPA